MTNVRQDSHASSVVQLEAFQGCPVLVHTAGRYPSLITDDGAQIDRYIDVAIYGEKYQVTGCAGYGYGGIRGALTVGSADSLDEARRLFPKAQDAIEQAPRLYATASDIYQEYAPSAGPLSRHEYESLAATLEFDPEPDEKLSVRDFLFPQYGLDTLPRLLTNQRRALSYKREVEAKTAAAAQIAAKRRASQATTLRSMPVLRTGTRFVPMGLPNEFLQDGHLFTVVSRHGR